MLSLPFKILEKILDVMGAPVSTIYAYQLDVRLEKCLKLRALKILQ